jgi:hypothetical protein
MTWAVGVDEAGYGPNLGPFVMSAAACRLPDDRPAPDLWCALRTAVRRGSDPADGRLLVDDSKVVHEGARGLAALERGVLAALGPWPAPALDAHLTGLLADGLAELRAEHWYRGDTALPARAGGDDLGASRDRFLAACAGAGVGGWTARCAVVCPPRFNALTEAADSKAAVLSHGLGCLLRDLLPRLPGDDAVDVLADKHGGRNAYAAPLQQSLPAGAAVVAEEEGPLRSRYRVVGLGREVTVTFRPRAEAAGLTVALASMASKYLRELLMAELNRFWAGHVPGLRPTAGYPTDAARFLRDIRPAAERLGVAEAALWRRR